VASEWLGGQFERPVGLSAVRFGINHRSVGWNIGERRPRAVLLLVGDKDEDAATDATAVIERIDAHVLQTAPPNQHKWNKF
jgi:hypothetical protein